MTTQMKALNQYILMVYSQHRQRVFTLLHFLLNLDRERAQSHGFMELSNRW